MQMVQGKLRIYEKMRKTEEIPYADSQRTLLGRKSMLLKADNDGLNICQY